MTYAGRTNARPHSSRPTFRSSAPGHETRYPVNELEGNDGKPQRRRGQDLGRAAVGWERDDQQEQVLFLVVAAVTTCYGIVTGVLWQKLPEAPTAITL